MVGRVVYDNYNATATGPLNINTLSWESGNYIIKVKADGLYVTKLVTVVH
jgi:hypothetical protein